ncbi:MAG: hypothetical protein K8F91_26740, partial [Candidatus Obscuribacterales bacterium]|nr:hypothetical protein [Candidatus Obscuribacterales bacterium]
MRKLTTIAAAAAVIFGISTAPAFAQATGDAFTSQGVTGDYSIDSGNRTGSQTMQIDQGNSPLLQGATN